MLSASDSFAGPLPGGGRPAFSYLMLGALRGWADEDGDREIGDLAGEDLTNEALANRMQLPGVSQRHAQLVLMLEQPRDGEEFAGKRVEPGALTTGVKCLGLTRKRLTAGSEHQRAACCSRSVRKSSTVARMRASSLSAWPMTLPASPTAISPT